jgi:hypothetical protein
MTPWSHLPNAEHIDRVVAHQKAYPEVWKNAYTEAIEHATSGAERYMVFESVMNKAYSIEGRCEAVDAVWDAEHTTYSRGALLALIAYDDAVKYLDLSSEKLKMITTLSEHPAAILLLHAVIAFEEAKKVDNKPNS